MPSGDVNAAAEQMPQDYDAALERIRALVAEVESLRERFRAEIEASIALRSEKQQLRAERDAAREMVTRANRESMEREQVKDAMIAASEEHTQHWEAVAAALRAEKQSLQDKIGQLEERCEKLSEMWQSAVNDLVDAEAREQSLRAENGRLQEALRRIADWTSNEDEFQHEIARAALAATEETDAGEA